MGGVSLTVIIPISFAFRGVDTLRRLVNILTDEEFRNAELIVVLGTTGGLLEKICEWFTIKLGARLIKVSVSKRAFSAARLRNAGLQKATADYVLFWDVDLRAPAGLLDKLFREMLAKSEPFLIIPCLYLSSRARTVLRKRDKWKCSDYWIDRLKAFDQDQILYMAFNTSTLFVKRDAVIEVGAFDEKFSGHGYEDFDLCCRLAYRFSEKPFPTDMLVNLPTNSPAFSRGFRAYLNQFSVPQLIKGIFTLHEFHPLVRSREYLGRRQENYQVFASQIRPLIAEDAPAPISAMRWIQDFLEREQLSLQEYSFLFCNMSHSHRMPGAKWRRFRKSVAKLIKG